jgi:hypothetical protein
MILNFLSTLNPLGKFGRSSSSQHGFASGRRSFLSKRIKLFPAPFFLIGLTISLYVLCHLPSLYASDYTINSGATVTINNGSLSVDGNITISGELHVSTGTISLTGNWTNNNTFTCGNSTVTFTSSTSSTLTGNTTFHCLVSTTTNKQINFTSASETYVTGNLNFENIYLRSTLQGATWYLTLSGTQDLSSLDVRDSNASGGTKVIAYLSIDSGNNTNWDFGPPEAITNLNGQCDSETGYVNLSWSTPGDDYNWQNTLVSTSGYRIAYSTESTKQWDKEDYQVWIPTYGVTPHNEVSHTITGLTGDSTYYFRIWTRDEIPLWSGLSNGATVYVCPILSVSISTDTYDFGEVPLGNSTHTVSLITVINEGNMNETYSLKVSSITLYNGGSSLWKSTDTTTGHDRFILYSIFHGTNVATSYFQLNDAVVEENRSSTSERYTYEGGSPPYKQTGVGVPPGEDRKIWFRLDMPASSSSAAKERIQTTITAGSE